MLTRLHDRSPQHPRTPTLTRIATSTPHHHTAPLQHPPTTPTPKRPHAPQPRRAIHTRPQKLLAPCRQPPRFRAPRRPPTTILNQPMLPQPRQHLRDLRRIRNPRTLTNHTITPTRTLPNRREDHKSTPRRTDPHCIQRRRIGNATITDILGRHSGLRQLGKLRRRTLELPRSRLLTTVGQHDRRHHRTHQIHQRRTRLP